jgi:hypothetical protein
MVVEARMQRADIADVLHDCFVAHMSKFVNRLLPIEAGEISQEPFANLRLEKVLYLDVTEGKRVLKSVLNFRSIPEDLFVDHMAGLDNAWQNKSQPPKNHNRRKVVASRNQTARSSPARFLTDSLPFCRNGSKLQPVALSRLTLVRPMKPCRITAVCRPDRSEGRQHAGQC